MAGIFDDILEKVGEPYGGGGKGFEHGTHKVVIGLVEASQTKTKNNPSADTITVSVYDPNDVERDGQATLFFHTEGGARMSVVKILGILVHNVGEEKKDKVRELGKKLFSEINDTTKARDIAVKLMSEKLVDKEAYFFVEPRVKYKTSKYGDLWHYKYEDPNGDSQTENSEGEALSGNELDEATAVFDDL